MKTVTNEQGQEFIIKPIESGHVCPDCEQPIMMSDTYRTLVDRRRVHFQCGPAPIEFATIDSIPARMSFTVGIDSIDWFTICWYRWYFSKEDGFMVSKSIEWDLRHFWKICVIP